MLSKRPYVHMLMMCTLDGRIISKNWPCDFDFSSLYEEVHRELNGDAWIVGRVTMAEFSEGEPRPVASTASLPRTSWRAAHATNGPYAIALDARGKLHLNTGRVNGDAVVAVLTERVADTHLAELRRDGISYVFAGAEQIDLCRALEILATDFGIERLLLEGGGMINGAFLKDALIDELRLLLVPFVDGASGTQSVFDSPASLSRSFELLGTSTLRNDVLHLKYKKK